MQRLCLGLLRFCLCTWVGVAMFFNVAVLRVLESLLYDRPPFSKFSEPAYFLPPYFGFAAALLGTTLLCTFVNLWNARIGLLRRWAILLLVVVTFGMIAADYAIVYRNLLEMFGSGSTTINASAVVTLFQFSRLLKTAVLVLSIAAAILVLWPESDRDLPPHRADPAL